MTEIASPDRAPNGVQSGPSDAVPTEPGSQERGGIHRRGGQHRVRWIALAAIIMAAIITFALAVAPPSTQAEVDSPLVGQRAPAITGTTITASAISGTEFTGIAFDLGALRGSFVVVDFFASWCIPCRTEQPELVKFAEQQNNGVFLVGVIFDDTIPGARSLLGPWVGLYPVIPDPGGRIALNYGVYSPPSKYVIDPEGTIVAKIIGPVTAAGLDSIITRAKVAGL